MCPSRRILATIMSGAVTLCLQPAYSGDCEPHFDPTASISVPGLEGLGAFPFDLDGASQMAVFDDGSGPALYVAGVFTHAGGEPMNQIAKWDGEEWSPLGNGIGTNNYIAVQRMLVFDDGSGSALYVGGHFAGVNTVPGTSNIARWDGDSWSSLGGGVNDRIMDMAIYDDGNGPQLYVGGWFSVAGGQPAWRLARWDGSSWSAVPGSETYVTDDVIRLAAFDGSLYISGRDWAFGGSPANNIVRWNGSEWDTMDGGTDHWVISMSVMNVPGHGEALYVGGIFEEVGDGIAASHIAKWDGNTWSPISDDLFEVEPDSVGTPYIWSMEVYDDGNGPNLWVAGSFISLGGMESEGFARWDGTQWNPILPGVGIQGPNGNGGQLYDMQVFDDGTGSDLYFTGLFLSGLAGNETNGIGVYRGCPIEFTPGDMNNDTVVDEADGVLFCDALGSSIGQPNFNPAGDLNNDDVIDHLDLAIFNTLLPQCEGDIVTSATFAPPPDGTVDGADLAFLLGAWGASPSCADLVTGATFAPPPDGVVDGADLAVLLGAWGSCAQPSTALPIDISRTDATAVQTPRHTSSR